MRAIFSNFPTPRMFKYHWYDHTMPLYISKYLIKCYFLLVPFDQKVRAIFYPTLVKKCEHLKKKLPAPSDVQILLVWAYNAIFCLKVLKKVFSYLHLLINSCEQVHTYTGL